MSSAAPALHRLLVVGGNGFIGSAVCRIALARAMEVTSISSSGRPYTTPKGHSPAWTSQVKWLAGDALNPETYAHILPNTTAVVHTIGTLLEDMRYKTALKEGGVRTLYETVLNAMSGKINGHNPLDEKIQRGTYESLNRDAALRVCETFVSTNFDDAQEWKHTRPFIYLSAEDMGGPLIPPKYIITKRAAERGIESLTSKRGGFRGVYVRPSLVYHAHLRPITTPIATLLDISAGIHKSMPSSIPTPASILRFLSSYSPDSSYEKEYKTSMLNSLANALTLPPIHVDHVAQAICSSLQREDVSGPIGVKDMRALIGWTDSSDKIQNLATSKT